MRFVGMLLEPVLKVFDIRAVFVDASCGMVALPETNSSPLKIDGWKTIRLPFGVSAYSQGRTGC